MKKRKIENAKVGLFVLAGLLFLVFTLYMIGRNQHLFKPTFSLKAVVDNVNGLLPGNNVRFKGINVGTVKSIDMINDTAIYINMVINNNMKPYIKKNALTSIGTDGLMGNKLIQINPQEGIAESVEEGDVIYSQSPVGTDELMRNLNTSSQYIERISFNLYEITSKLNDNENLWSFLADSIIARDIKLAVGEFYQAGKNTFQLTQAGKNMLQMFEQGNGLAYRIFMDTALSEQLTTSLELLHQASNDASLMIEDVKEIVDHIGQGDGSAGLVLMDSLFRETLLNSALNLEEGTDNFNQNMEALKRNFLFRRYFRKLERQQKKDLEERAGNE